MPTTIRILLVDDSAVIRRLLTDVLSGDPALEVADSAANGRIALAKLSAVKPDIVILDVEMPEMDGLETLAEIRKRQPRLPVIMFSTLTERGVVISGAEQTISARAATEVDAALLGCAVGQPVLHEERHYVGEDGTPVELAASAFLPEHYTHRLHMGRRPAEKQTPL